jgi:methionyl-tRNA formyltransferase
VLPALLAGTAPRRHNDLTQGGYFGGRTPEDGRIDWTRPAQEVYNLHRAVAPPYPGAFTDVAGTRYVIEHARLADKMTTGLPPGLAVVDNAIFGVCGDGRALAIHRLLADGAPVSPEQLARAIGRQD